MLLVMPEDEAVRPKSAPRTVGRYVLHAEIASGGFATVHLGRLLGPVGFARTVAIKRLHSHFARDPEAVSMFLDEARLAARLRHPNVVQTLDVVITAGEIFLVMEYVTGESLSQILASAQRNEISIPPRVGVAIATGVLRGLHAAHEAIDERGVHLQIVHRDVSPHNVLVGADGVARIADFGVAKAVGRLQVTREGRVKGKLPYMAPEQARGTVDRRSDIYAASVVLWEMLTRRRLFKGDNDLEVLNRVLTQRVEAPSRFAPEASRELDAIVMRGLNRDPSRRFASAEEMASALEEAVSPATPTEVGRFVQALVADALVRKQRMVASVELTTPSKDDHPLPAPAPAGPMQEPTPRPKEVAREDGDTVVERFTLPEPKASVGSLSPSRGDFRQPGLGRWGVPAVLGLLMIVTCVVVAVIVRAGRPDPRATDASAESDVVATPLETPSAHASTSATTIASTKSQPWAAESNGLPAQPGVTPGVTTHVGVVHAAKTVPKSASPKPAAAVDCSKPFVLGEDGVKKLWKKECLR